MRRFFYAAHAPEDAARIGPLFEAARAAGHLVWSERLDADAAPMDLGAVLRNAHGVIIFCSADAFTERAIYKELVLAARSGKRILPVYLDDQLPPDQYLYYLSRYDAVRARDPHHRERFLRALEAFDRGRRRFAHEPVETLPVDIVPPPPLAANDRAAANGALIAINCGSRPGLADLDKADAPPGSPPRDPADRVLRQY